MKTTIPSFLITLLVCLGFSQNAHSVTPPPDGGYPGGNTAEGGNALFGLTTGTFNTAVGLSSLSGNRTGDNNTAIGAGALFASTASENTAMGAQTLLNNNTGNKNTADGAFALSSNIGGSSNTAIGHSALNNNTSGNANTANGVNALFSNLHGASNTANGTGALISNVNGDFNTATGASALLNNTSGARDIALGAGAGASVTSANNVICIGTDGANTSNSCYIGQIFSANSSGGTAVFINSSGKLGTRTSSLRFKEGVKPMERASEGLYALKPVTFCYKKEIDPQGIPQFGLVAEDVEAVNPNLVVRDKDGKVNTVRYEAVNAMLLNEFLKEHRKVEELQATVAQQKKDFQLAIAQQRKDLDADTAQQQKEIQALAAIVKEQAAQIQKVSAQLEASKPAPHVVNNP